MTTIKPIFLVNIFLSMLWAMPSHAEVYEIANPHQAPAQRVISMEEVWRIGDDADEPYVLGVIQKVISDEQGNFYFLDTQLAEVFKFSPDGQYLKSVSRKGEGPGELSRSHFFGFWDENTVACFNNFPHKFVRFDLDGLPFEALTPVAGKAHEGDGRMAMSEFERRDGFLVARGTFFLYEEGKQTQKSFLMGFDDNAEETFCYGKYPTGYDFNHPITVDEKADFIPIRRWTLGRNGELYIASQRTKYLIDVYDAEGKLLRKITREWPLRKRTDEEKEDVKNGYIFGVNGRDMPEISYKIDDYPQTILALKWIDDQLWVVTSDGAEKGKKQNSFEVDVFDGEGHLLEARSYEISYDQDNDRIHWLDHGRAIIVKNFASAKKASRSSNVKVQRGDGQQETAPDGDCTLEVILYQTK